ncbi:putative serine/threonine-protein kinase PBL15 [Cocos nucifera]|uniref:Putative serine/threonine-protein kinase PBL15 n=1 Tax=Cocos nucifera TaxID=13894 RepID=A0A8K0HUB6_COCNU|nr:putative serine/threonine-protein kinase PBL15 [Cocos nucifera]
MNFQAFRPSVIHYGQEQLEILTNGFADQIGHGGSGRVYKGKALDSEMAIAIKCLNEGERYIKMWKTELTLLNKFQHKNIINLVGYCPAYPSLAIMTEFMEKGDLREHVDSDINWLLRVQIAYAVAKALRAVHAEGVTLHDFKTSNVLIDEDYTPKIGDFGIAVSEEIPVHWQLTGFGTYGYIDPMGPYDRGQKVDVFAYGQMLFELLAKEKYAGVVPSVQGQLDYHFRDQSFHQNFAEDPSYNIEDGKKLYQIAKECSTVIKERPKITAVVKKFKSLKVRKWLVT